MPFFIFTIILLIIFCIIKNKSLISSILSLGIVSLFGYYSHIFSHNYDTLSLLDKQHNVLTNNPWIKYSLIKICNFLDFHDKIHHDTTINKKPINLFLEAINNFATQGGLMYLTYWLFKKSEPSMFLLWAFFYTTVHNINYLIYPSKTHIQHHMNKHTNYGIDFWDLIFNSKYVENGSINIEDFNHGIINLIIGFILLYYIF